MTQKTRQKILIIDDTPANLALTGNVLGKRYDVRVASSGKDALEFLKHELADLILLDILMPDMDGYEVIEHLKAHEKFKEIPVIFLTMLSEVEDEKRGLALGAVDFIIKPILPELLLARVNIHLELVGRQKILEEQAEELRRINSKLQKASEEIKTLRGILPLCSYCKKIRIETNEWMEVDVYIHKNSDALISHGLCPDCLRKHYPEEAEIILKKMSKPHN